MNSSSTELDQPVETPDELVVWKPSRHELLVMIALSVLSLMISLDATVIITSLSTIITDLHGNTTGAFWIGTSYLLACAVTMPFTAALSNIFGRAICLLTCLAFFTVGTVLCCIANTLTVMLVGRSVQGVGGGGIIVLGLVIFTDIVPLRFRSQYYGIIQSAWAIGTCTGPVLGGVFVEKSTWRWAFYCMFPFCLIGFASISWLLTMRLKAATMQEKLLRVDWIGGLLFISSSTAFLVAISTGGTQEPWKSYRTIAPLVLGSIGLGITGLWERYGAREPFLSHKLFHCYSAFAAYFGSILQGFLLYAALYYGPLYFLAIKEASPVRTGIDMFPTMFSLVPASIVVGTIITRSNRFRWAIWLGWIFITLATGLMILWDLHTKTVVWAIIMIILGIGHGFVLNAQNFATQAMAPPKQEASAAAMYIFLRSFGMALGVGISGSVFQNVMKMRLDDFGLPASIAQDAEAYIAELRKLPAGSSMKIQIQQSYIHGLRGVYAMLCGLAALGGLASLLIRHFDLNRVIESEHKLVNGRILTQNKAGTTPKSDAV